MTIRKDYFRNCNPGQVPDPEPWTFTIGPGPDPPPEPWKTDPGAVPPPEPWNN